MSLAFRQYALDHRRLWLAIGTATMGALAIVPSVVSFGPVTGEPGGLFAAVVVTAAMGFMFLLASRNPGTSRRLRQALVLLAASVLLIAAGNLVRLVHALGVPVPRISSIGEVSEFVIWALGFLALIRIPLMPVAPENRWRVAIDIAISYIGMALVLFVIWMLPGLRDAPPESRHRIMFYNFMEAGNLWVLNLILVRGSTPEIRRAVGWMSAAVAGDTIYLITFQYSVGRQLPDDRLLDSAFFAGTLVYLIAAFYFLCGPQVGGDPPSRPTLLRMINPLPFCAVLGVGAFLIISALQNSTSSVAILSAGIVLMTVLLLVRVVVSTLESLRFAHEKFDIEQRAQAQKMGLIKRLSGGVSHVVNNLMTVVLGNAQLLRMDAAPSTPNLDKLDEISKAALKASRLAGRLMLASGTSQLPWEKHQRLADAALSKQEPVMRIVGNKRDIIWDFSGSQGDALVAPSDLEAIVTELVANAAEATYHAGKITIRIRDEVLLQGFAACPTPGPYSVLEVSDSGPGIAKSDLPHVVEPFFTTRPLNEGRGLGLSVVNGIVLRYHGGLLIDTLPGSGSRVRVYLPIAAGEQV